MTETNLQDLLDLNHVIHTRDLLSDLRYQLNNAETLYREAIAHSDDVMRTFQLHAGLTPQEPDAAPGVAEPDPYETLPEPEPTTNLAASHESIYHIAWRLLNAEFIPGDADPRGVRGTVVDTGGGQFKVYVDEDTRNYPDHGRGIWIPLS